MLSLDCTPVIRHVVRRTKCGTPVDDVVVATTKKDRDRIVANYASKEGAEIFRGDEEDVLGRMHDAADKYGADQVVRITADNPLLSPAVIDTSVQKLQQSEFDYVSNKIDRTFPSGLDVEAFTFETFTEIERKVEDSYNREHVTPYYRNSSEYRVSSVESRDVFDEAFLQDRTDLRLTLDTPDDYELLHQVYENVAYDSVMDVRDAVRYIDENDLAKTNTD
jgi:spore coat polysaccharide biosynthesis protein SpsF